MDKVTLIVPTLNELKGMQAIMPRIKREWYDQLIVLDGHSKDGTLEWAKAQGYDTFCQNRPGLWYAFRELYESGMVGGGVVITFSPDGNSIPETIPTLLRKMALGYDMVIASRYMDNAKSQDDTAVTWCGNRLGSYYLRLLCNGVALTDPYVIYRAYRADIIKTLGFITPMIPTIYQHLIPLSPLVSWEIPLTIRAIRSKLKICEVPSDEPLAIRQGNIRRQNTLTHAFVLWAQVHYEAIRSMK